MAQTIVSEDLIGTGGCSQAYSHDSGRRYQHPEFRKWSPSRLFNRAAIDMASPIVSDPSGRVIKAGAAIFWNLISGLTYYHSATLYLSIRATLVQCGRDKTRVWVSGNSDSREPSWRLADVLPVFLTGSRLAMWGKTVLGWVGLSQAFWTFRNPKCQQHFVSLCMVWHGWGIDSPVTLRTVVWKTLNLEKANVPLIPLLSFVSQGLGAND